MNQYFNMIKQHPNIYLSSYIKEQFFAEMIKEALKSTELELNQIYKTFYSYDRQQMGDSYSGLDNLFRIIERSWVGIFNNALLKVDSSITTLQEFSVWDTERSIGRCDLLFAFEKDGRRADFIAEAKLSEFKANWKKEGVKGFYLSRLKQAFDYFEPEKKYYESYKSDVWLMVIIVEWMREKMVPVADSIMQSWKEDDDPECDFLTFYDGGSSGAFLYGKVMRPSDFLNQYINFRV